MLWYDISMGYIPLIIGAAVGFAVGHWVGSKKGKATDTEMRGKVLALLRVKHQVTNDDVQHVLGVSDATATRYLDALQRSGDVVQMGDTGRGVVYRKK